MGIPSLQCVLFCHPFGAGYVMVFSRGFTPGYILSALRACCRALLYAPLCVHSRKAEALPYV